MKKGMYTNYEIVKRNISLHFYKAKYFITYNIQDFI